MKEGFLSGLWQTHYGYRRFSGFQRLRGVRLPSCHVQGKVAVIAWHPTWSVTSAWVPTVGRNRSARCLVISSFTQPGGQCRTRASFVGPIFFQLDTHATMPLPPGHRHHHSRRWQEQSRQAAANAAAGGCNDDWEFIELVETLMNLRTAYAAAGLTELAAGCEAELDRIAPTPPTR